MSSTSERSFGARLENSRKLKTTLQSFPDYQPASGEFSIDDLIATIQSIETINPMVASALIGYRQSVADRREVYATSPLSIKRIITPINAFIRAKFGKEATSYVALNTLVNKIRGTQLKAKNTTDNITYSVSQQSYGSIILNFQNLIANLESLGPQYNPANSNIIIAKLIELKNQAIEKNNNVVEAYSQLSPKQDSRVELYNQLAQKATRIKDFVKSQYGVTSSEYNLIKGLKI
jgi:hypothetical protein